MIPLLGEQHKTFTWLVAACDDIANEVRYNGLDTDAETEKIEADMKLINVACHALGWLFDPSLDRMNNADAPKNEIFNFLTKKQPAPFDVVCTALVKNPVCERLLAEFKEKSFHSMSLAPKVKETVDRFDGDVPIEDIKQILQDFEEWNTKMRGGELVSLAEKLIGLPFFLSLSLSRGCNGEVGYMFHPAGDSKGTRFRMSYLLIIDLLTVTHFCRNT